MNSRLVLIIALCFSLSANVILIPFLMIQLKESKQIQELVTVKEELLDRERKLAEEAAKKAMLNRQLAEEQLAILKERLKKCEE